jgi:hypothetical protein
LRVRQRILKAPKQLKVRNRIRYKNHVNKYKDLYYTSNVKRVRRKEKKITLHRNNPYSFVIDRIYEQQEYFQKGKIRL